MFNNIKENFTKNLYDWMKINFSDVCSSGDVLINNLLDELYSNKEIQIKPEWLNYIEHVYDAYNNYLKDKAPNPFWAD